MKTISNQDLQDRFDKNEWSQYYPKGDSQYAKIGLEIYKQVDDGWILESSDGIKNPDFNCISFDKWGSSR